MSASKKKKKKFAKEFDIDAFLSCVEANEVADGSSVLGKNGMTIIHHDSISLSFCFFDVILWVGHLHG